MKRCQSADGEWRHVYSYNGPICTTWSCHVRFGVMSKVDAWRDDGTIEHGRPVPNPWVDFEALWSKAEDVGPLVSR